MSSSDPLAVKRLFVAIRFPEEIMNDLAAIRPRLVPGITPVKREQLHLTLHFVGDSDFERIGTALEAVVGSRFLLTIEGVGQFRARDGSGVLWAGVSQSAPLMSLHAEVARTLIPHGFVPEARPYSPHVTLGRYKSSYRRGSEEASAEIQRIRLVPKNGHLHRRIRVVFEHSGCERTRVSLRAKLSTGHNGIAVNFAMRSQYRSSRKLRQIRLDKCLPGDTGHQPIT